MQGDCPDIVRADCRKPRSDLQQFRAARDFGNRRFGCCRNARFKKRAGCVTATEHGALSPHTLRHSRKGGRKPCGEYGDRQFAVSPDGKTVRLEGEHHHEVSRAKGKVPPANGETGCASRQVCHLKAFVKMRIEEPFPIAIDIVSLAGNGILRLVCQHGDTSMGMFCFYYSTDRAGMQSFSRKLAPNPYKSSDNAGYCCRRRGRDC